MEAERKNLGGRPTTYEPIIGEAIIASIAATGCSRTAAAECAGVDEAVVRGWEAQNPGFSRAMKIARGERKRRAAERLHIAAEEGDTSARIFTAKCLDPEQWTEKRDYGMDPIAFAAAVKACLMQARAQDGLEPPSAG